MQRAIKFIICLQMRCTPLQSLGCVGVRSGMQVRGRFFVYSTWIYLISCRSEKTSVSKFCTSVHARWVAAWKTRVSNFFSCEFNSFNNNDMRAKRECIWERSQACRKSHREALWLNTKWPLSDNKWFSETRSYKLGSSKQRRLFRSDSVGV